LASILLVQSGGHHVHVHIQDNESTDGTRDIAEAWSCRGVTYKSEKDEGLYNALEKATSGLWPGQIMTWLGSDDFLMPGALATVASAFETFPEVSWLSGLPFVGNDAKGSFVMSWPVRYSRKDLSAGLHDGRSCAFLMQEGTFWRTDLWIHAGGVDANYRLAGDWDLWRRFAQFTPLYMLNFPIARFTIREGQASSNMAAYYREVDRAERLAVVEDDTAYRLTRGMGETWRIETESKEAAEAAYATKSKLAKTPLLFKANYAKAKSFLDLVFRR
jgi:glycosyltransferase involved in cell wall biosynthesis